MGKSRCLGNASHLPSSCPQPLTPKFTMPQCHPGSSQSNASGTSSGEIPLSLRCPWLPPRLHNGPLSPFLAELVPEQSSLVPRTPCCPALACSRPRSAADQTLACHTSQRTLFASRSHSRLLLWPQHRTLLVGVRGLLQLGLLVTRLILQSFTFSSMARR